MSIDSATPINKKHYCVYAERLKSSKKDNYMFMTPNYHLKAETICAYLGHPPLLYVALGEYKTLYVS